MKLRDLRMWRKKEKKEIIKIMARKMKIREKVLKTKIKNKIVKKKQIKNTCTECLRQA